MAPVVATRCTSDVLLTVVVLVVCAVAFSTTGSEAASDPWRALYRPLKVPRLAEGQPCPVSRVDRTVDFRRFGVGLGVGRGPAYPVGLNVADGTLTLAPAENFGSRDWMGQKVLWFVHPRYRGPVLIRGRQLDGPYRVRFERGSVPPLELRIAQGANGPRGARAAPSYTRLRTAGCYGYQIDGSSFSRIVVFRAVRARS